jgi:hypothetical protein
MDRTLSTELYRCDLCHRPVDAELRARARRGWQPLIICDRCIRDASGTTPSAAIVVASAR